MLPIRGTVEFSTFTAISDQERCSVAGPLPLESRKLTYIRLSFEESGLEFHAMQTDVGLRGWFIENQMSNCKGWKCLWRTESQINVWDLIHTLSIKSLSAKKETLFSASPKSNVHRFQTYMFGRGPRLQEGRKSPAGGLPTNHESIRDCALPLCVPVWSH